VVSDMSTVHPKMPALPVDVGPRTRGLLAQDLGEAGCQAPKPPHGTEGIGLAHRHGRDIVLPDRMMKDIPGFDVTRALNASG
jgi:DNA-binding response OmpR family regulator